MVSLALHFMITIPYPMRVTIKMYSCRPQPHHDITVNFTGHLGLNLLLHTCNQHHMYMSSSAYLSQYQS